jgi:type IV pilus assembly protein PilW
MSPSLRIPSRHLRSRATGMSLLELMIALALGALLVLGLAQLFSASKASFLTSQGLSRVQEASRFTVDFLQRDLRQVGLMGCSNDLALEAQFRDNGIRRVFSHFATTGVADNVASAPTLLRFDMPIEGWEATATGSGATLDRSASEDIPLAAAASNWSPAVPAAIWSNIQNIAISGSDIIAVRFPSFDAIPVNLVVGTPNTLVLPSVGIYNNLPSGMLGSQGLYMLTRCDGASFLQVTGAVNAGTLSAPVDIPAGLNTAAIVAQEHYDNAAMLYRMESYVYFVGLADHDNDGTRESPALFRLNVQLTGTGTLGVVPEELVDGVENLQLRYRWDNQAAATVDPDGILDTIGGADAVAAAGPTPEDGWRAVGSVQVGVLIRAPDRSTASARNSTASCADATALGGAFCVAGLRYLASPDERIRQAYDTTVTLRNRLNGS